jgi:molybdopterin molybdotransferase
LAELLSVSEAQVRLIDQLKQKAATSISIKHALHLVLAENIYSPQDFPSFSNSGMDGFALRAQDIQQPPNVLSVIEDIPAGSSPRKGIGPGQAARIMTGAPIPEGSDAVVPVEETDQNHSSPSAPLPARVTILTSGHSGQYIRPRGQDLHTGDLLLQAGRKLSPQDIGLLASAGIESIPAIPRPRIALFSSGDELCLPGSPLFPGQIYDSNMSMIEMLLREQNAEVVPLGIARDNPQDIDRILDLAVNTSPDVIISTAGVSVGTYDFIRQRIQTEGMLEFWRVNMRPGKPIAFGAFRSIPYVGLPGNPVSAFVTCMVFVLPGLRKLAGLAPFSRKVISVILEDEVQSDGRESYLRAVVTQDGENYLARLSGHQGSANLFALTQANALLIIPSGVKSLPAGQRARAWLLKDTEN